MRQQVVHFVVGHRLGKLHVDRVELVEQRLGFGNAQLDIAAHVQAVVEFWFLRQVADLDAGLRARFANILGIDAGHDAQQRRLARAVVTQHADLGARKKIERNILQNFGLRGHYFAHPVHGIDVLRHADCPSSEFAYSNSAQKIKNNFIRCRIIVSGDIFTFCFLTAA